MFLLIRLRLVKAVFNLDNKSPQADCLTNIGVIKGFGEREEFIPTVIDSDMFRVIDHDKRKTGYFGII